MPSKPAYLLFLDRLHRLSCLLRSHALKTNFSRARLFALSWASRLVAALMPTPAP